MDKKKDILLKMRHTAEHVLTQAMLKLYPGLKMAMGPATKEGFYFDFEYEGKISEDDFEKIEKEMQKIIKKDLPVRREEVSIKKARELFSGNEYKQEWIDEIEKKGEQAVVYWTGDEFVDLCSGPHVKSTGEIGAFKLLSVAGAYWRGDEKNKMLTRIYGTAFHTKKELDKYLKLREEAKKRDHKILGPKLDLFTFSELIGPGLPLWTPKGTIMRNLLDEFVWELRKQRGYQKVEIPHIAKNNLYKVSGHWDKFANDLFRIVTREGHEFAIKPMNCPHHVEIFKRRLYSYREMPQRYANTTMVYRDEQSGELSGLSRVRSITQDDAHVFCGYNQLEEEIENVYQIVVEFYSSFGFELKHRLSLHDPEQMDKYLGDESQWVVAETRLRSILDKNNTQYDEAIGEAAFYGPKIDFMSYDSLGREWQVATIQLDLNMPSKERFDLTFAGKNGTKERVVMIHAAIMGSIERFMAVIIEHFAGAFPVWLHPVQVKILPISDEQLDYAQQVMSNIKDQISNIRAELDDSNETLGNKIRKAQEEKVPYMLIVGAKEQENETVNLRLRNGKEIGEISVDEFVERVQKIIESRSLELWN